MPSNMWSKSISETRYATIPIAITPWLRRVNVIAKVSTVSTYVTCSSRHILRSKDCGNSKSHHATEVAPLPFFYFFVWNNSLQAPSLSLISRKKKEEQTRPKRCQDGPKGRPKTVPPPTRSRPHQT